MLFRVLLYGCILVSGLAWFMRVVENVQTALTGNNALLFVALTVGLGCAAIADAVDGLRAALKPAESTATEKSQNGQHDDE
jgi:hypothetical protein